jgi:hypothetical protein
MRLIEKVDRNFRWKYVLGVGAVILLAGVSAASYSRQGAVSKNKVFKGSLGQSAQAKVKESLGKLPLAFEANKGQTDPSIQFVARAAGYTAFVASDGVVMRMKGAKEGVVAMKLQNAKLANKGATSDQQPGKSNYFRGSDRSKWIANISHYGKVTYEEAYPGVDLAYSGNQRNLEYDFVVKPGVAPQQIRMQYLGATRTALTASGDLELVTDAGSTIVHKPVVYQTIKGQRKSVEGGYVMVASNEYAFKLGAYDASKTLVIDPMVTALAYLGGTGDDQGLAIAVNTQGEFLTGETSSVDFPLSPGACLLSGAVQGPTYPTVNATCAAAGGTSIGVSPAYQIVKQGGTSATHDVFVTKIAQDTFTTPGGSYIVYSTYIGGTGEDVGQGIAVDSLGDAFVTGYSTSVTAGGSSVQYPVTGGLASYAAGTTQVAFLTELSPAGNSLVYSTILGSGFVAQSAAVAIDGSDNAYIGGLTTANGLPTASTTLQSAYNGGNTDGFFAKFSPTGVLTFASYLGGLGSDQVNGIALDGSGNIYLTGTTTSVGLSPAFPVTPTSGSSKAISTSSSGSNGFVTKIKADLSGLSYSATFGAGSETANAIVVDGSGNAYVGGGTFTAGGFGTPVVGTAPTAGNSAPYLAALKSGGTAINFLDYGPPATGGTLATGPTASYKGVAIDSLSQVYAVGSSGSVAVGARYTSTGNSLPLAAGALTSANSTFTIGPAVLGPGATITTGIAVNANDTAFVVGTSNAPLVVASGTFGYPGAGSMVSAMGLKSQNLTNATIGAAQVGGNDAIFAGIQFQDFALSTSSVTLTQAVGGSAPTPGFFNANFVNPNPSCGTANLVFLGTAPTSTSIPKLPSGATAESNFFTISSFGGNTVQVALTGTPTGAGSYVQNETFSSTCSDNSVTIQFVFNLTAQITVTPQNTLNVTEANGSGIISPINSTAGDAIIPVTVTSPLGVASLPFTVSLSGKSSNFPSSCTNGDPGLVSFYDAAHPTLTTSYTTGVATPSGFQFFVDVAANCVSSSTPVASYTATINVGGAGVSTAIALPFSLTVSGGLSLSGTGLYTLTSVSGAVSNVFAVQATTGGPFSYAATYTPATPATGVSPLPANLVTFLSGATGTVSSSTTAYIVMQVSPTGLATGTYTGSLSISPTGTSSFAAPTVIPITAVVGGGGLYFTSPSTGVLNLTAPAGIAALPSTTVTLGTTSSGNRTINGTTSPVGVSVSSGAASWLSATGTDCTISATSGTYCSYTITPNAFGLTAGTVYTGTVTFKTNESGSAASTAVSTTLTVNLTVATFPGYVLTGSLSGAVSLNPATNTVTFHVPPIALTGNTCSSGITLSSNGGTINNTIYTVATTSPTVTSSTTGGSSWLVLGTNPGPTVGTPGGALSICVNPSQVGSTGTFLGSITASSGTAAAPLVIPVQLIITTPGSIDLSNVGVYRGAGIFALDLNQSTYNYTAATTKFANFGLAGDQPVAGDWLGTGTVSVGIFRAGAWYFDLNNDGVYEAGEGPFYFGLPGDQAIVGDWTGTGTTKVGVFRCPASGACTWYLSTAVQTAATLVPNANLYSPATTLVYTYGLPGDQPVANNWSGTSKVDQIGVFRCPAVGVCSWIVDNVGDGVYRSTDPVYAFGLIGDLAVVGDWNDGGQRKRIGVFRAGTWILDVNGSNVYAPNDIQAAFGLPGDLPVVGKWTIQ